MRCSFASENHFTWHLPIGKHWDQKAQVVWFLFRCTFHSNSPLPSQRLNQVNSREPLLTSVCSPAGIPNACTYIPFGPIFLFPNESIQWFILENRKPKTTSLSPFISSREAPHFHPGTSGTGRGLRQRGSFWVLEGSVTREGESGERVQKVT